MPADILWISCGVVAVLPLVKLDCWRRQLRPAFGKSGRARPRVCCANSGPIVSICCCPGVPQAITIEFFLSNVLLLFSTPPPPNFSPNPL